MSAPTVSIGLPVYNGQSFIEESINSILMQDFEDFELIVADNASEDQTEEICRQYSVRDRRVRYYRSEKNMGAAWNYNRTFNLSNGKYFKWAAHDDLCLPNFLSKCVQAFEESTESLVLVYGRSQFIDGDGRFLADDSDFYETRHPKPSVRLAHVLRTLHRANALFGVIRSNALKRTRLIDSFISSDHVLLAELSMLGKIRELPDVLFLRRLHDGGSLFANKNNRDLTSWFDPSRFLRFGIFHSIFPKGAVQVRVAFEIWRSVLRMPISSNEKALCLEKVLTVYGKRRVMENARRWKKRALG